MARKRNYWNLYSDDSRVKIDYNLAFKYSLFILAIFVIEIPFGHSTSHEKI